MNVQRQNTDDNIFVGFITDFIDQNNLEESLDKWKELVEHWNKRGYIISNKSDTVGSIGEVWAIKQKLYIV